MQRPNAPPPILVTELGMVTEVRLEQSWNALSPILVTELGMLTEVRLSQKRNALSPILVTESGMVIEVRPECMNAPNPILTTLYIKPKLSTVEGITRVVPVNEFHIIVTVLGPSVSTLYVTSFTVNSSPTAAFTSSLSNINGIADMQINVTNKRGRYTLMLLRPLPMVFPSSIHPLFGFIYDIMLSLKTAYLRYEIPGGRMF